MPRAGLDGDGPHPDHPVGGVGDDTEKLASSTWVEYDVTPGVSGDGPLPLSCWPSLRTVPSASPVMALSPRSWSSRSRT